MNASIQIDPRPLSLTDLPSEILLQISLLLDQPSAISLSQASRVCMISLESKLWRELDLTLPLHFGQRPWVQQYLKGTDEYEGVREDERIRVRNLCRTKLRERMRKISSSWDERRVGLVREMKIASRYGVINQIISILIMVAPHLQYLHLCPEDRSSEWETIPVVMLHSITSFPALTHIRIESGAIRLSNLLTTLVVCAPNLVDLDVDIDCTLYSFDWEQEDLTKVTPVKCNTEIRSLRASFRDDAGDEFNHDLVEHPIWNILSFSPLLEKVSLRFNQKNDSTAEYIQLLGTLVHLQDLHWEIDPFIFRAVCMNMAVDSYPSLRRLVLESSKNSAKPLPIPYLPALEILYFTDSSFTLTPRSPLRYTCFDLPHREVFEALRNSPKLRFIHNLGTRSHSDANGLELFSELDDIESAAEFTARISSVYNVDRDHELVMLRLKQHTTHTDTGEQPDVPSQGSWADTANFWSMEIPSDVLNEMRRVEGVSADEWQGRRIEVQDATWAVLSDWVDDREAEADKSGWDDQEGMGEEDEAAS